jgi:tetrahydromethanopterin S-methyltransferase subunit H
MLDENAGKFDKEKAEGLIKLQEEFSDKTGNPCMLDVVGTTEQAMKTFISFVGDVTEKPFLIDSPSPSVRAVGAQYVKEVGLEERAVYNSLMPESKAEEFESVKQSGLRSSILLAYKGMLMTSEARVKAIKDLLPKVEEAGINKPLVDTCVLDVPSLAVGCRAILDLKAATGFPCGCGAHNAISTWAGFKKRMGAEAFTPCAVSVNTMPIVLGADFVLYGPLEDCKYVFPAVNAINMAQKYLARMKEQVAFPIV